jgi:hypothetical protein
MSADGADVRCKTCGRPIFLRHDGTWDLVWREQDNTVLCYPPDGGELLASHTPEDDDA